MLYWMQLPEEMQVDAQRQLHRQHMSYISVPSSSHPPSAVSSNTAHHQPPQQQQHQNATTHHMFQPSQPPPTAVLLPTEHNLVHQPIVVASSQDFMVCIRDHLEPFIGYKM